MRSNLEVWEHKTMALAHRHGFFLMREGPDHNRDAGHWLVRIDARGEPSTTREDWFGPWPADRRADLQQFIVETHSGEAAA